jgi:hypothetical protein
MAFDQTGYALNRLRLTLRAPDDARELDDACSAVSPTPTPAR